LFLPIHLKVCWLLPLFLFSSSFSVSYIYNHIHTVNSSTFIRRGFSPFLHCLLLRGKNLPGVPSRDSNSGLPYRRPAYQQSFAAPPYIWPLSRIFSSGHQLIHESLMCSSFSCSLYFYSVLRIWIRRIRMFLGLLDPDPVVRGTIPYPAMAPDPSIIKQCSKINLNSYCFVPFLWLFIFEKWCKCSFKK
jgi:hypothetical protein